MKKLIFIAVIALLSFSCKKEKEKDNVIDNSGSLLDTKIDTTWKASDGSTINIKITTSYGPKDPLFNDNRDAYHATLYSKVLSGSIKSITVKLTYRHFPKDYSEYEVSTGYSYPVDEEAFSTTTLDPAVFPILEMYHFIPDPGPIDRIEISL
ncbi:MAG: hypothetical protein QM802_12140 [Agriterribacter sp.]